MSGMAEEFVYDASFIKLKELSLGYSFPEIHTEEDSFNFTERSIRCP